MLRILIIIFLATLSINFAYKTLSEADNPEPKISLTDSKTDTKTKEKKEPEIVKHKATEKKDKEARSKEEKIKDIEVSINKIKDEWVIPFKPNLITGDDEGLSKIKKVDDKIKELAERTGAEKIEQDSNSSPDELYIESADIRQNDSQFSYLAEPQLKPLAALSQPISFINPVGGKIVFKPEKAINYNVNSYSLIEPASTRATNGIDRRNKVNTVANQTKNYKKRSFISSIGLAAAEVNQKINNDRAALIYVFKRNDSGAALTANERIWLTRLAKKYEVSGFSIGNKPKREELLSKVNVIPESLAVAQAALESGWGSSNLARQGFNYFGHKCFGSNCRANLKTRANKSTYAVFYSPKEAVEEYVHNLNTNKAYQKFRVARDYLGANASGKQLVHYLDSYSVQGNSYEQKIKQLIESNRLE